MLKCPCEDLLRIKSSLWVLFLLLVFFFFLRKILFWLWCYDSTFRRQCERFDLVTTYYHSALMPTHLSVFMAVLSWQGSLTHLPLSNEKKLGLTEYLGDETMAHEDKVSSQKSVQRFPCTPTLFKIVEVSHHTIYYRQPDSYDPTL